LKASILSGDSYESSIIQVNAISLYAPPDPPKMISAVFSDDGVAILVKFDSSTDAGGYQKLFNCDAVFQFFGAAKSTCLWTTSKVVRISLASVVPSFDSDMTLLPNTVAAYCSGGKDIDCNNKVYAYSSKIKIERPVNPIKPTVTLSAPRTINICSDIVIDSSRSFGACGVGWKSILWDVSSSTTSSNITDIRDFLNAHYDASAMQVTVPNRFLIGGNTYTFTLYLENFLSQGSIGVVTVDVVTESIIPIVSISGPKVVAKYRWQEISLLGLVSISNCGLVTAYTGNIVYSWSIYMDVKILPVTSTSADSRIFKVSLRQFFFCWLYLMNVYVYLCII
jgi:hypothetical protein